MDFNTRLIKLLFGWFLVVVWLWFMPDFARLLSAPLGRLTLGELFLALIWVLCVFPVGYGVVSYTYEAITGREWASR